MTNTTGVNLTRSMSDEIKFKCERCRKDFDPDPEMVCETGEVSEEVAQRHDEEWKGPIPDELVKPGAIILCQPCLEALANGEPENLV